MIYVTSDLHLNHNKDFLFGPRHFNNVEEMNQEIVRNWNKTVTEEDEVYILGDIMLGNNVSGAEIVNQLKGKIHIILGNHDTDNRIGLYSSFPNVVSVEFATRIKYKGYYFFLSHYPTVTYTFDKERPLKTVGISLCGHLHTTDPFFDWNRLNAPIYHCELDAHNMTPVSMDYILEQVISKYNQQKAEKQVNHP